jgi:hypothetical protein
MLLIMSAKKRAVSLFTSILFGTVLLLVTLQGVLLVGRYGLASVGLECEINADNESGTVTAIEVNHEAILTTIVYAVMSVLRIMEYVILGKQLYFFLFRQDTIDVAEFFTQHSRRFYYLVVFSVILLPYLLSAFAIPALGVYQEVQYTELTEKCYHYYEFYVTYCVIDVLRYLLAYSTRLPMMFVTISLSKYWFPEHTGPPQNTSLVQSMTITNDTLDQRGCPKGNAMVSEDSMTVFLQDWEMVSTDFKKRADDYVKIGNKVAVINEIFQPWFIIPWVIYFTESFLKTHNVLRPWDVGDGPSDISLTYYTLFNVNHFITLLIPYLCIRKINTYHQKYYNTMRNDQLKRFEDIPSCLSFARQLKIEKDEQYDFVPRIIGSTIQIDIGNPLYAVFLLAGLFLAVTRSLF